MFLTDVIDVSGIPDPSSKFNFPKNLQLGPTEVKGQLLNYDIFLNEFMTFSWKCHKLSSDIYENMSEIHSKIS